MKVCRLIQFQLSTPDVGLWHDHDKREYNPKSWGIVLKLFAGDIVRPFTRPAFWGKKDVPSKWNNFDDDYHFLIRAWFPFCPFISIALGKRGVYAGFKVADFDSPKYEQMLGKDDVYIGSEALVPSITIRSTRWK